MKIINNNVSISDIAEIMDHTSSGYFDIGTMRMQWGISSVSHTGVVVFPTTFLNTSYSITCSPYVAASGLYQVYPYDRTTSQFQVYKVFYNTAAVVTWEGDFSWMAIGLKP